MTKFTHIILLYILTAAVSLTAAAQESSVTKPRANVSRTWLFGAGSSHIYDSYLSPLDYKGAAGSMTMVNERTRLTPQHLRTTKVLLDINGSYASNPIGNGHFYDGQITIAAGHYYGWRLADDRLRLAVGGLAELSIGGTYSTRNGNNPAQARATFDIAPSGSLSYGFHGLRHLRAQDDKGNERLWQTKLMLDVPLVGLMFSPQYGQSYYEMFELHNYDHNICFAWPGNAPSARLLATLSIPVGHRGNFVLGYRGIALQSRVNHLGRHTWQNGAVIGFTHDF